MNLDVSVLFGTKKRAIATNNTAGVPVKLGTIPERDLVRRCLEGTDVLLEIAVEQGIGGNEDGGPVLL